MSEDQFIRLLQSLITMSVDKESTELAGKILKDLFELVRKSNMADAMTVRAMFTASSCFEHLVRCREDFAGVPGDYCQNENKRRRLWSAVYPHC